MNEQTVSLTEALSANSIAMTAVNAGKVLLIAGITGVAWRDSSKPGRPAKSFKVATALGEILGAVNERNTLPTGDPTNLKFMSTMFSALWELSQVQAALADLLEAGDVKMRAGGEAKQEIF